MLVLVRVVVLICGLFFSNCLIWCLIRFFLFGQNCICQVWLFLVSGLISSGCSLVQVFCVVWNVLWVLVRFFLFWQQVRVLLVRVWLVFIQWLQVGRIICCVRVVLVMVCGFCGEQVLRVMVRLVKSSCGWNMWVFQSEFRKVSRVLCWLVLKLSMCCLVVLVLLLCQRIVFSRLWVCLLWRNWV